MSRKDENFNDSLRGEYDLEELKIVNVGQGWKRQSVWAICITSKCENLTPLKLYKAEFYPQLSKVKVLDEDNKPDFYPQEWFLSVEFAENVKNVLEKVV